LLGHAAGLKNQALATSKLDGYFVFRHKTPLFIVFAWETCRRKAPEGNVRPAKAAAMGRARAKEWLEV
jgi:hypothetical protein